MLPNTPRNGINLLDELSVSFIKFFGVEPPFLGSGGNTAPFFTESVKNVRVILWQKVKKLCYMGRVDYIRVQVTQ